QIRAQVTALLERDADAHAIGIFSSRAREWPEMLTIGERRFALRWCESPLAVRLALHEARLNNAVGTVILTSVTETDLGSDVLARLSRGRVFRVQQWEIVRAIFQARSIEARLSDHG